MKQQPLVSIIIPTYNRAHLIGETLDSVLAQTYTNWECIIVDDGSTDNTDDVVGAYVAKDLRFKYYHRPPEHLPGGNGARNFGFRMSRGEYVNWFDSDDLMSSELIKLKVDSFSNNYNLDFVVCSFKSLDNKGKELFYFVGDSDNYLTDYLFDDTYLNTYNIMWKRISIKHFIWDETLFKHQDLDFLFKVLAKSNLNGSSVKEYLITYRIQENAISKYNASKYNYSRLKVRENMYFLSKNLFNDRLILRIYHLYLFEIKNVMSKRDYKSIFKTLKAGVVSNQIDKVVIYTFLIIHFISNSGLKYLSKYFIKISS